MVVVFSRFAAFTARHPILRGMLAYGTIWPTSCLIQQTMAGKNWETYDWAQVAKFSMYGALFTAPTLYSWVKLSSKIWPKMDFKTAVTKAAVEQMTYGPAALAAFFFGMSLLDGKTIEEAKETVKLKFWPAYKVAICVWPILQTYNFCYVPERNRVPFTSACSLVWCCFLAYMHQLQLRRRQQEMYLAESSNSTRNNKQLLNN